jgi:hypothetical protein
MSYNNYDYDKNFRLIEFEKDLKKGARDRSTREAARVLLDATAMSKKMNDSRLLFSEHWDPSHDPTLEEYLEEKRRKQLTEKIKKQTLNPYASEFVPSGFKLKKKSALKSKRVSRKVSRKMNKSLRKSMRKSRKTSRRGSTKINKSLRKSMRKSRKTSRRGSTKINKSLRKSMRKSRKTSRKSKRKMGKKEMTCTNLLKKKIGINMDEFKDGRYKSREQAIAVAYNQVKSMNPLCGKYFKRN